MQEQIRPGPIERGQVVDLSPNPWFYESVTYQMIMEEGIERGVLIGMRRVLIDQGTRQFGPPSAATAASLEGFATTAELGRLIDGISSATSWEELLAGR